MQLLLPAILVALATSQPAPAPKPSGSRILGEWLGSSVCANAARMPDCRDETIRYFFSASKRAPGSYRLVAERLVKGRYQKMYEMEFGYSASSELWSHEFSTPACPKCRWWYHFDHASLVGGMSDATAGLQRKVTAMRLR